MTFVVRVAVSVRDVASERLLLYIGNFLVAGSRGEPLEPVEHSKRSKWSAACFALEIGDRSLYAMMEYGGYPMSMLKFSYTSRGFCMSRVGQ